VMLSSKVVVVRSSVSDPSSTYDVPAAVPNPAGGAIPTLAPVPASPATPESAMAATAAATAAVVGSAPFERWRELLREVDSGGEEGDMGTTTAPAGLLGGEDPVRERPVAGGGGGCGGAAGCEVATPSAPAAGAAGSDEGCAAEAKRSVGRETCGVAAFGKAYEAKVRYKEEEAMRGEHMSKGGKHGCTGSSPAHCLHRAGTTTLVSLATRIATPFLPVSPPLLQPNPTPTAPPSCPIPGPPSLSSLQPSLRDLHDGFLRGGTLLLLLLGHALLGLQVELLEGLQGVVQHGLQADNVLLEASALVLLLEQLHGEDPEFSPIPPGVGPRSEPI